MLLLPRHRSSWPPKSNVAEILLWFTRFMKSTSLLDFTFKIRHSTLSGACNKNLQNMSYSRVICVFSRSCWHNFYISSYVGGNLFWATHDDLSPAIKEWCKSFTRSPFVKRKPIRLHTINGFGQRSPCTVFCRIGLRIGDPRFCEGELVSTIQQCAVSNTFSSTEKLDPD